MLCLALCGSVCYMHGCGMFPLCMSQTKHVSSRLVSLLINPPTPPPHTPHTHRSVTKALLEDFLVVEELFRPSAGGGATDQETIDALRKSNSGNLQVRRWWCRRDATALDLCCLCQLCARVLPGRVLPGRVLPGRASNALLLAALST